MSVEESIKRHKEAVKAENIAQFPIFFTLNQYGKPKQNSLRNVGLVLEADQLLSHTFAYNNFTHEIELLKTIPELYINDTRMKDDYTPLILRYIEDKYQVLFPKNLLESAIINEAIAHSYNPVIDYLNKCFEDWDKEPRVNDLLPTYLGVEDTEITKLQTRLFLVGAVAKVFKPETKFDFVLDLVGGQGAGKTTLLKKLSNGWYTDQFSDFRDKDSYVNMLRSWIVNDDEMTATARSSFEDLKKFASAERLEFRKAYGKSTTNEYKNFVLSRTTNQVQYLKDKTGSRRFLPNLVDKKKQLLHPVQYLDQPTVNQIWGEAVNLYKNDFSFNLTDEEEEMLNNHRSQFIYIEPFEEEIDRFLENSDLQFTTSADIAKEALRVDNLATNPRLGKKIKNIMDNKDGWSYKRKMVNGSFRRGYEKI
ncbi:VapE domain-containing protein [Lactobacillus terrae]|uniref:VapE domain-containing protein n=1 Tax=Lactobacillus terrae TaxID=2269374 RepID=UPI000C1B677B|nr:VapE domain-containing protein [Lactobacillus terrae]